MGNTNLQKAKVQGHDLAHWSPVLPTPRFINSYLQLRIGDFGRVFSGLKAHQNDVLTPKWRLDVEEDLLSH